MPGPTRPCITVLAGTNGAGKSSIGGALLRQRGGDYFNPDEAARRFRDLDSSLSQADANSLAWHEGTRLLERAIENRRSFMFETTLGGRTIARLLERAIESALEVKIWYAGLETPELHIERVRARVARGGHDIPEADIRRRYTQSMENLIMLLPGLTELAVFDNSRSGDPRENQPPQPRLLLHMSNGQISGPTPENLRLTPDWAKPIVAAALRLASPG